MEFLEFLVMLQYFRNEFEFEKAIKPASLEIDAPSNKMDIDDDGQQAIPSSLNKQEDELVMRLRLLKIPKNKIKKLRFAPPLKSSRDKLRDVLPTEWISDYY